MIKEYLEQLKGNGKSVNTIKTYTAVLKALNNFKPVEEITKGDLITFFKNLKGTDETRRTYQAKIKKFFTDNEKKEMVEWIRFVRPKEKLRADDILTTDDINIMLETTNSDYWRAWISIAFESGARFSEIGALRYKDFKETTEGLIVDIPTTKTASGFRRVILILSAEYFRNLKLYKHASDDDIVFKLKEPRTLIVLKSIARKAGIPKRVNPHAFRHAQATILVQQGMQEALIRKKLGWTPTSPMIARYQHLDDNDVVEATLRNHGKAPKKIVFTEIKQPEKITLVDAAMQFSKLSEENRELKERVAAQEAIQKEQEMRQKEQDENIKMVFEALSIQPDLLNNLKNKTH